MGSEMCIRDRMRVFLRVDAIVEALVKYLARRFHPWQADTTPSEVVR